jgi:hypothetical protein
MKLRFIIMCIVSLCLSLLHPGWAQTVAVPNASFEKGADNILAGWTPGGKGQTHWENTGHTGNHSISVLPTESAQSLYWSCNDLRLKPRTLYQLSFWSKHEGDNGGSIISGFSGINHDFSVGDSIWTQHSFVFITPDKTDDLYLRLGQWNGQGKIFFDDVALQEMTPVPEMTQGFMLGDGEQILGNTYSYRSDFSQSNYFRGLQSITAGFNTNRWVFGKGAALVFCHDAGASTQRNAKVTVNISYYKSGKLVIEASRDGQQWMQIATGNHTGNVTADIPATLLPAKTVYIRLRAADAVSAKGDSAPGSFQVSGYQYTSTLDETAEARGATRYLAVENEDPQFNVKVLSLGKLIPGSDALQIQLSNPQHLPVEARLTLQQPEGKLLTFTASDTSNTLSVPYQFAKAGAWKADLEVRQNHHLIYEATLHFSVPSLYAADYGERIGDYGDLWWAGSNYKISQTRPLPAASDKSTFVPLQLARNEYEAVQIVARPQEDISRVIVKAGDLTGSNGAKIDHSHITVDEVAYVPVDHPTDSQGAAGNWPDPLPPLKAPVNLKAHQNQPFWITVYAPANIPAGVYRGKVLLSGNNWRREVPLQVTVWNFTLSKTSHLKSAIGLSVERIAPYYHVSNGDLRTLLDKYYANFAEHRVAPPDPIYGVSIKVDWGLKNDAAPRVTPQQVKVDFSDFDRAMENAMQKYHFASFRLSTDEIGWRGSAKSYAPGRIGKYAQGSSEYEVLFGSYIKQVQDHLEEKGWLDKAYLYFYDEPEPAVYKQISEVGNLIHRYAPKLKWMLTEQAEPELVPSVDIFDPRLDLYNHQTAADLQAQGKEFWWYICTAPKAPYVGEFIDRPGIEPRLWLWQTWKNKVQGILIWTTVCWTSKSVYPDSLQDPWKDTESWLSSGGRWGNGDGRWLYPPRRDPNTDKTPDLDAPINSIRWEALRDGMEDYEYFWMLQQQVNQLEQKKNQTGKEKTWLASAKVLLQVPDSISASLTDFSTDPALLMQRRAQIAEAIVAREKIAE